MIIFLLNYYTRKVLFRRTSINHDVHNNIYTKKKEEEEETLLVDYLNFFFIII